MRALIHIIISLMILQAAALQSVSQRRSRSAPKNNPTQVRALIDAADRGDLEKVIELLDKGVSANVRNERSKSELSGMTPLMIASLRSYENTVEALIKRGANVNLKHYSGQTALMLAAGSGNVKTVRLLLAAGANPNVQMVSFHGGEITPLTRAINNGEDRIEIAKLLLAAGAQINPTGTFAFSPLMHALDDLEMVKLLIAHGADVNQKNFRGATALMAAAGAGPVAVVRYLLEKGADVNARDQDGNTALKYAEERDPSERNEILRLLKR